MIILLLRKGIRNDMNHQENITINVNKIMHAIKKVWMYCALIIALSALCAYGITTYVIPKTYEAIAKVIVVSNQNRSDYAMSYADIQVSQKLTDTYAQIMLSERISDMVVQRLSDKIDTQEYRNHVKVNANSNTEIMNITVTHTDPTLAAILANEIVHVFLHEISTIMPINNVSILNQAKVPIQHKSPSLMLNIAIGLIIGLGLCGLLILVLLYTDRRIKQADDLVDIVSYPFIGSIPLGEYHKNGMIDKIDSNLISIVSPNSVQAEAYRSLRTNLMLRNFERELKMINVISTSQGEGKTTLMINLAMVLGQINKKVLLIDLDLRAPKVHKMLRLPNTGGITQLMHKEKTTQVSIQSYEGIDIITAGETIPFTSEFLQSNVLSRFLASAKNQYDYILLDCPPAGIITDGTIVSNLADGTILVVGNDMITKKELSQLDDLIQQFNLHIIGTVLTKTPIKKHYQWNNYHDDKEKNPTNQNPASNNVVKGHA